MSNDFHIFCYSHKEHGIGGTKEYRNPNASWISSKPNTTAQTLLDLVTYNFEELIRKMHLQLQLPLNGSYSLNFNTTNFSRLNIEEVWHISMGKCWTLLFDESTLEKGLVSIRFFM